MLCLLHPWGGDCAICFWQQCTKLSCNMVSQSYTAQCTESKVKVAALMSVRMCILLVLLCFSAIFSVRCVL